MLVHDYEIVNPGEGDYIAVARRPVFVALVNSLVDFKVTRKLRHGLNAEILTQFMHWHWLDGRVVLSDIPDRTKPILIVMSATPEALRKPPGVDQGHLPAGAATRNQAA